MPGTYRPNPRYPAALGARLAQADHLARALQGLFTNVAPGGPSYLWLLGRADEVRAFVGEIAREWSDGAIDTACACEAIRGYVGAVHVALHHRYGAIGAACCGPHLEPIARPSLASITEVDVRSPLESGVRDVGDDAPVSRARPLAPQRKTAW